MVYGALCLATSEKGVGLPESVCLIFKLNCNALAEVFSYCLYFLSYSD